MLKIQKDRAANYEKKAPNGRFLPSATKKKAT